MSNEKGVGRPTLYRAEYCDKLIDHMADGLSYQAFAGAIGVSKQTIYDWEEKNPDFKDAKAIGSAKCLLYWEMLGRDHIINKTDSQHMGGSISRSLNGTVYRMNMINRFKWVDKASDDPSVVINNNVQPSVAESEREARAKLLEEKQNSSEPEDAA